MDGRTEMSLFDEIALGFEYDFKPNMRNLVPPHVDTMFDTLAKALPFPKSWPRELRKLGGEAQKSHNLRFPLYLKPQHSKTPKDEPGLGCVCRGAGTRLARPGAQSRPLVQLLVLCLAHGLQAVRDLAPWLQGCGGRR